VQSRLWGSSLNLALGYTDRSATVSRHFYEKVNQGEKLLGELGGETTAAAQANYQTVQSNEDIYKAKAESRKKRAAEPFERKLLALVRMQMMDYSLARSAGRAARKPWHSEDKDRMKKYANQPNSVD
jgi:hypothetical protein